MSNLDIFDLEMQAALSSQPPRWPKVEKALDRLSEADRIELEETIKDLKFAVLRNDYFDSLFKKELTEKDWAMFYHGPATIPLPDIDLV